MINILELIDGGFIGGGQTHVLSVAGNLDKEKFNSVIAASGKGEFRDLALKKNFNFEVIELPKIYGSKHLKSLDKIIQRNKTDIIHSHGGVAGMYARFYKKNYGNVKSIHTIHGIHYTHTKNFFRKFITQSVEQFLVQYTDKFICVSDTDLINAGELKIIDKNKTVVIKNGIDLKRFARTGKSPELMNRYGIKEKDTVIGNISRFDFQKNQRLIISHAAEILTKYPDVRILLAGDGKYLEECKIKAGESGFGGRIIFTGEIKDTEDHYPLFDIFIFPSLWEGLSISLIEAMASSSCILASSIPANRELIQENKNGLLFDLSVKGEFISKLEKLIENRNLREELSANAHSDSRNFSEKIMTEKIEKEYIKLMN
ncbi:MAG: glycosyltransferase [Ignavibacteria bacterium]|nr:glycosyltransferase [Ignavibacteria bacterium]